MNEFLILAAPFIILLYLCWWGGWISESCLPGCFFPFLILTVSVLVAVLVDWWVGVFSLVGLSYLTAGFGGYNPMSRE